MGFFDSEKSEAAFNQFHDPLVQLNRLIDWKLFLPILQRLRSPETKGFGRGRKPFDLTLQFKIQILRTYYDLSDDQLEYQIHDRKSFRRFLGIERGEKIPDAKTIWLFRDNLTKQGLVEELFAAFDRELNRQGYRAQGGQIVDATLVEVPRQRNNREENETIKNGETPSEWQDKPHKLAQKDVDARWTQKNGKNYYGYKNHISVDCKHQLVRNYEVTDAAVHDSQVFWDVIDPHNSNGDVYADSAYRSQDNEMALEANGYRSKIHHKGKRNHPLTDRQKETNKRRSTVRARVEHVFGNQCMVFGSKTLRCIGNMRARAEIGLRNLVYNLGRFIFLRRNVGAAA